MASHASTDMSFVHFVCLSFFFLLSLVLPPPLSVCVSACGFLSPCCFSASFGPFLLLVSSAFFVLSESLSLSSLHERCVMRAGPVYPLQSRFPLCLCFSLLTSPPPLIPLPPCISSHFSDFGSSVHSGYVGFYGCRSLHNFAISLPSPSSAASASMVPVSACACRMELCLSVLIDIFLFFDLSFSARLSRLSFFFLLLVERSRARTCAYV